MAVNLRAFHAWHRRLSLIASPFALAWALSGFVHPILSSLQPRPATQIAPAPRLPSLPTDLRLGPTLATAGISSFRNARVVDGAEEPVYLVELAGEGEQKGFSARTGKPVPGADAARAVTLARHYLGDAVSPLQAVDRLDAFSQDYPYVNRLLPAYRVRLDRADGVVAFVETRTDRLVALTTPWRSRLMGAFRILHSWTELDPWPRLRTTIMTFGLVVILAASLSGLLLYGLFWARLRLGGPSRWHRSLGLTASLFTVSLACSGFWHLQRNDRRKAMEATLVYQPRDLHPEDLPAEHQPGRFSAVAGTDEGARYRLQGMATKKTEADDVHAHHSQGVAFSRGAAFAPWVDARTGALVPDGETRRAISLARAQTGLPPNSVLGTDLVTQFGGEYGFIYKRLPVVRVRFETAHHDRLYIEPASGEVAAWIRDADAQEGSIFSTFHKAEFMTPWIGKDLRNAVLSMLALLQVAVVALGLTLWLRRRRALRQSVP